MIGGDSALTTEDGDRILRSPKVFERGGLLFGVSGEMRVGQLIQHVFDIPAPEDGQDIEQFVVRDLCGRLRGSLREHAEELLPSAKDDEEVWSVLVGIRGRLFRICSSHGLRVGHRLRRDRFGGSPSAWILRLHGWESPR